MICPRCEGEYVEGVTWCSDCDVPLVPPLPVAAPNASAAELPPRAAGVPESVQAAEGSGTCPACGSEVTPASDECPECGLHLGWTPAADVADAGDEEVDRGPGWVAPELLRRMAARLAPVKQASYEALRIDPGHWVLDVGCGPATDTLELAGRVGEGGFVLGVDSHPQMIAEAERRAAAAELSARVTHRQADARDLPFEDGSFDACRSERLFQHLEEPEAVLAEMMRVTRPGGRLAVVDADHGLTTMDTPESEVLDRLVQARVRSLPNGLAGRRLFGLLRRAGLAAVEVTVFPVVMIDYEEARRLGQLEEAAERAVEVGIITREELDRLRRSLEEAQAAGAFFGTSTLVLAAGTRP